MSTYTSWGKAYAFPFIILHSNKGRKMESKKLYIQESSEGDYLVIKPVPGQVVAQVDNGPNMLRYARLFAAAPELLCSLTDLVHTCEDLGAEDEWEPDAWHHLERARRVIARAKSEWVYESK